jgi:hypothetical protein
MGIGALARKEKVCDAGAAGSQGRRERRQIAQGRRGKVCLLGLVRERIGGYHAGISLPKCPNG